MSGIEIRPLTRADAAAFRMLRLEGLRLAPEAFSAAYEDEIQRGDEDFAGRIPDAPPSAIFGAFQGEALVGVYNQPARALYGAMGFEIHGVERHALRLPDGRYIDEELRVLELRSA
ncbi:MAG: hypothetical protein JWO51_3010 [Rhodospirillales bacterium]|nr:hypothetical protein [Rhodospirillales bacterium]